MKAFEYVRPSTVEEACRFLAASGGQAKALAGGTDLLVQIRHDRAHPETLMSLQDFAELSFVRRETDGGLAIGSMAKLAAIENSPDVTRDFPSIAEAASFVGSIQVRNRATLGGNLCNAAPSADMTPILIALDAKATITSGREDRTVALEDFFAGPGKTVLKDGELLRQVSVPAAPASSFARYVRAYRSAMDIAIVGVAVMADFDPKNGLCRDLRLVLGAVAPTAIRAKETEKMAIGRKLDADLIDAMSQMAAQEAKPISDVRSSAEYRKTMVAVLSRRALHAARTWADNGGLG